MIVKYDHNGKFVLYECSVCRYTHKEYYDGKTIYTEVDNMMYGKKPFIEGETQFLHTEEVDYAPDRLVKSTVYVCPRCGVLQLDVDGV